VKQLHSAVQLQAEDSFSIDEHELNQVTFIGVILSPDSKMTNFSVLVNDGTGTIRVRVWMHSDDPATIELMEKQWCEHTYVRVIGSLRSFNEQRSVVAYRMIPIDNFNELTYHHLEVIYVHLTRKYGTSPQVPIPSQQSDNFFQGNTHANTKNPLGNLTDQDRAVLAAFKEAPNNDSTGFSIATVCMRVRSMYTEAEVKKATEKLWNAGYLYSTIDNFHFLGA